MKTMRLIPKVFTLCVCLMMCIGAVAGEVATPISVGDWAYLSAAQPSENVDADGEGAPRTIDPDKIELDLFYRVLEEKVPRERVSMSIEQCVVTALEANQDIVVASYEPLKASADVLTGTGEFDPVLNAGTTYTRVTQQASSQTFVFGGISAVESYQTDYKTALSGKLHWGTQYDLSVDFSREETTFNQFIEEWSGGATLTLTQPLLRGRGKPANLARIRAAKNTRLIADEQLHLSVMNTIADVVKAYWDLAGAIQNLEVRQEALANAERLVTTSEKRLEIGTAAAIEVLQAKAGLASRQSDLITAQSQVADAEDVLKNLLSMREDDMLSPKRITPITRPTVIEPDLDEAKSFEIALEHRPEMQSVLLEVENAKLEERRASNDLLPQLDLTGSLYEGGRDHFLSNVVEGVFDGRDTVYTISVQGSVPLGNRAARGAHQRARLAARQVEQRVEKVKHDLLIGLRLAVRGVRTARVLVESNRQTRTLQEANLVAEEKRLRLGTTTSYRVLEVQEDLTAAQTQEVQALTNFEKALIDLYLAEGTLLPNLGVEFELPEPETRVSFAQSIIPPEFK